MRIINILPVKSVNKLYRTVYDEGVDILEDRYNKWTDTEWLYSFFTEFKRDLDAINEPITIRQAIRLVEADAIHFLTTYSTTMTTIFQTSSNHSITEQHLLKITKNRRGESIDQNLG